MGTPTRRSRRLAACSLGVNPFAEPNVSQAKDATTVLLKQQAATGALPMPSADLTLAGGVTLTLISAARRARGTATDVDIPGQDYSFGTLELAQALGDVNSLEASGRRAIHMHLPVPDPALLASALQLLA